MPFHKLSGKQITLHMVSICPLFDMVTFDLMYTSVGWFFFAFFLWLPAFCMHFLLLLLLLLWRKEGEAFWEEIKYQ